MNIKYVPSLIMLVAGVITCIMAIIRKWDVTYSLGLLLGVLVIFFLIGTISRKLIVIIMESNSMKKKEQEDEEEQIEHLEEELKNDK